MTIYLGSVTLRLIKKINHLLITNEHLHGQLARVRQGNFLLTIMTLIKVLPAFTKAPGATARTEGVIEAKHRVKRESGGNIWPLV